MKYLLLLLICCALNAQTLPENDYYNNNFNPFEKNDWFLLVSLGFEDTKSENNDILSVDIISNHKTDFNINLSGGYFLKEFLALGLNLSYQFDKSDLNYQNSNDTISVKRAGSMIIFSPFIRNYIPISKNKRFNLFNSTQLSFGFGDSTQRKTTQPDQIEKYYEKNLIARLGIKPGVNVFIIRNFVFEIGIDLIGFQYEHKNITYNETQKGKIDNYNFDFNIKLLSLDFGLAYYF